MKGAWVRLPGEEPVFMDPHQLEEDVRAGRIRAARVNYPPWTGEGWRDLGDIEALRPAFDAPAARLVEHFHGGARARASAALTLLVALAGLVQLSGLLHAWGLMPPMWAVKLDFLFSQGRTGFEPILLEDRWWSPWASQFTHGGPEHLFPNLGVLGYCGWRVERAGGSRFFLLVCAASLLLGTLMITLGQEMPVIGSSILGFGLWGAQLALGFRLGDTLPEDQRRFYGYGNLLFFAVLASSTVLGEQVAHLAHIGGFLAGVVVATVAPIPTVQPASWRERKARGLLGLAAALTVATALMGPAVRLLPALAWGSPTRVTVEEAGITLEIPSRLLPADGSSHSSTWSGLPAWSTRPDQAWENAFCGLQVLAADQPVPGWDRSFEAPLVEESPPAPLGPGWSAHAWSAGDLEVLEQRLVRGRTVLRCGQVAEPGSRRAELFLPIVASVQVGEPPALARARERDRLHPGVEALELDLARALRDVGQRVEADTYFAKVIAHGQRDQRRAVEERLALQLEDPAAFPLEETPWFLTYTERFPEELNLRELALRRLVEGGACETARRLQPEPPPC